MDQHPPSIDVEIIEKKTSEEQAVKPPPLPHTNNPLTLLGLSVAANFDAIKKAYKEKVKIYHPDILVGPDASPEERQEANWDFARVNAAYDILKRKDNEEVYEYEMHVDGEQVTRTVYVDNDQPQYKRDAHYIDYNRIRQVAEYRKNHPKKKQWYEEEHEYQPTYDGFDKDASYCSNEKWYNHLEMFEYEQEMSCPPYIGFVSTQERMRRNGFGVGHQHGQDEENYWHNRHTFETSNEENRWSHEDNAARFDEEGGNSVPNYNDHRWYRQVDENEFGTSNGYGYDNYEPAQYDPIDTWYNDEPQFDGNFGP